MTQFWLTNFCSSPFWHLKFLQPPIPLWETGEEREKKNRGGKGLLYHFVLFHNKATIFPCESRTPSWEKKIPKRVASNCTEQRHRDKKNQKQKTGEEREKKQGRNEAAIFAAIPNAIVSEFCSSRSLLNPLVLGEATTLGGADVGETLPYHQHHPILSSS